MRFLLPCSALIIICNRQQVLGLFSHFDVFNIFLFNSTNVYIFFSFSSSCLKSIAELESSGLFNCTCPMRKKKTLDRCMHIFNRLANNTCLGKQRFF